MINSIRAAFEKRLKTLGLPVAAENLSFTAPDDGRYFELHVIPTTPVDAVLGSEFYFETGITQVTVIFPNGKGTGNANGMAAQVRDLFARGSTLVEDGHNINVMLTPAQARGYPDGGSWRIPITVTWQVHVVN